MKATTTAKSDKNYATVIYCGGGVNHNSNYNGTTNISGATIMPINNTQQSINCVSAATATVARQINNSYRTIN
jgi:hypothetical protein